MGVPHFRNRAERLTEHSLGQADLHFEVTSFFDGSRTEVRVALMGEHDEEFYGEGIARCHPSDTYDRALGQHIAFLRAAESALEDAYLAAIEATDKRGRTGASDGRDTGRDCSTDGCADADCYPCLREYGVLLTSGERAFAVAGGRA